MTPSQDDIPIHPFEQFPRQDLFSGITRRQFFATVWQEVDIFGKRSLGGMGIQVPRLGSMEDETLALFIPRMLPEWKIELRGQEVWASQAGKKGMRLFAIERLTTYTFNAINGSNSIAEIADQLAAFAPLPYERAFAFTRGLFLTLVKLGVCLPVNNPFM